MCSSLKSSLSINITAGQGDISDARDIGVNEKEHLTPFRFAVCQPWLACPSPFPENKVSHVGGKASGLLRALYS